MAWDPSEDCELEFTPWGWLECVCNDEYDDDCEG